jgi:hypothetical protein
VTRTRHRCVHRRLSRSTNSRRKTALRNDSASGRLLHASSIDETKVDRHRISMRQRPAVASKKRRATNMEPPHLGTSRAPTMLAGISNAHRINDDSPFCHFSIGVLQDRSRAEAMWMAPARCWALRARLNFSYGRFRI